MKKATFFLFIFTAFSGFSQSLPFSFEGDLTTEDFIDFDGGTAAVIANPVAVGINTSATVAQIVRDGGEIWSGSKVVLDANLDFSEFNTLSMKVFTTAPVGTTVKFKLEGTGDTERDAFTTVSNQWETLTWDFTGAPANFNTVVFMFDFGNQGDGSVTSTFLFDDVEQYFGGTQLDLPVDFESETVNYTTVDFGGTSSSLVVDPTNPENKVIKVIKTTSAATWAGTTIGTPAGFATNIPLALDDAIMSARVWSPAAGTPIRLKIEDSNDETHTCETETNTTLAGEWEIIEFDFSNEAPGTAMLTTGLDMGWTYNMASIFFNFDTDGATAGEQTYFFDDVQFGEFVLGINSFQAADLKAFPNPSHDNWTITADQPISSVEVLDMQGKLLRTIQTTTSTVQIDATLLEAGIYGLKVYVDGGVRFLRVVRE